MDITEEKFWNKVDKKSDDECWNWKGNINDFYVAKEDGKKLRLRPKRFSWGLLIGPLKKENKLTNSCENLKCVNPKHLKIIEIGKADCHPDRPHFCRGMCKQCHSKYLYNTNESFRKKSIGYAQQSAYRHMDDRLARRRELRKENRPNYLDKKFKYQYGISYDDYLKMVNEQNGVCLICNQKNIKNKDLVIDHDHITKEIRGLLCDGCNTGLGHFKENTEALNNAIKYIKKYQERKV